jgi:hypothetical protein
MKVFQKTLHFVDMDTTVFQCKILTYSVSDLLHSLQTKRKLIEILSFYFKKILYLNV